MFRRHRFAVDSPGGDFNRGFWRIEKPFNAFKGLADPALGEKRMFEHAKAGKLVRPLTLSSRIVLLSIAVWDYSALLEALAALNAGAQQVRLIRQGIASAISVGF